MARSLRASITGIKTAEAAFKRKGWTQEYLAGICRCTRQVVGNFFARRAVQSDLFQAICTELGLEWGEIAEAEAVGKTVNKPSSIDELVGTVREVIRESIQQRHGTMRVLDMSQPIGLDDIYTNVNILEKITARRRLEVDELLKLHNVGLHDFERFSLSGVERCIPGIKAVETHSRLLILGKPGSGKTTFLKHLAIQCISGNLYVERIPAFVTLKDFAEATDQPSVLAYLQQLFSSYGLAADLTVKTGVLQSLLAWNETSVEQLLRNGRLLVLLDGLDEVRASDANRVLRQIRDFADQFAQNQIVLTCRIAAREYTFEKFTEVEIADFDDDQITSFARKWFHTKDDFIKAAQFTKKLKKDRQIRELATNPLLLTLLCITFEESGSFPQNRSELYKEGIDVLLKKWDIKRNIAREQTYKQLSLQRKEDLLSHIAIYTFQRGDYFFKQKVIEQQIGKYIRNLPSANISPDDLNLDSEAVLKSIEAQHGLLIERAWKIYSFSHLTFHEFFTARAIALSRQPQQAFDQLTQHLAEKRWREVFLLTVGLLPEADELLLMMKETVDQILARDDKLQEVLDWVYQKSDSVNGLYKPAAIRAFYFDRVRTLTFDLTLDLDLALARARSIDLVRALVLVRDRDRDPDLARALNLDLAFNFELTRALTLDLDLVLILALAHALALNLDLTLDLDLDLTLDLDLARALVRALTSNVSPELERSLKDLKKQLPKASEKNWENFKLWWRSNGTAWTEQLRAVMIQHCNIGHNWQFSPEQQQLLSQYYAANQLLVDCLKSECYVSREVREKIESTLLLPVDRGNEANRKD